MRLRAAAGALLGLAACGGPAFESALVVELVARDNVIVTLWHDGGARRGSASIEKLARLGRDMAFPLPDYGQQLALGGPPPWPPVCQLRAAPTVTAAVVLELLGVLVGRSIGGWTLCAPDGSAGVPLLVPVDDGLSARPALQFVRDLRDQPVATPAIVGGDEVALRVPLAVTAVRWADARGADQVPFPGGVEVATAASHAGARAALAAVPVETRESLPVALWAAPDATAADMLAALQTLRELGFAFGYFTARPVDAGVVLVRSAF